MSIDDTTVNQERRKLLKAGGLGALVGAAKFYLGTRTVNAAEAKFYEEKAREGSELNTAKRYGDVITTLQPFAEDTDNRNAEFFSELGKAYVKEGKWDLAEKYLLRSLENDRESPSPMLGLAIVYDHLAKERDRNRYGKEALRYADNYLKNKGTNRALAEIIKERYK
jgi:tetratricopeptide (TPR) repeat protein